MVEDLDSDGIEDHYDTDDDGDGFIDEGNVYGSDLGDLNLSRIPPPQSR